MELADLLNRIVDEDQYLPALFRAGEAIVNSYVNGGTLFAIGNGGSAADAQHFVAELVSKLHKDRTPIRAVAMTVDTSILTAIGNDYGYDKSFSRQVEGLCRKGDVLLSLTTSGNSRNVLEAMKSAKRMGVTNVLMAGRGGGACMELADYAVIVPHSTSTPRIQEVHLATYHMLAEIIEDGLVQAGLCRYV